MRLLQWLPVPLFIAVPLHAQTANYPALELMTADQRQVIGLDRMTETQKAGLNSFLVGVVTTAYAKGKSECNARELVPRPRNRPDYITGGSHWIQTNGEGKIITLEDGSMWQVSEIDRVDTVLWLPVTDITVIVDREPIGDYKYILVNKEDGEKAHARYLGRE